MGKGAEQSDGGGMRRVDSATDLSDLDDKSKPAAARYTTKRSKLIGMINWAHVVGTYAPYFVLVILVYCIGQFVYDLRTVGLKTVEDTVVMVYSRADASIIDLGWRGTGLFLIVFWLGARSRRSIYLLDFECWQAPESWRLTHDQLLECMKAQRVFTADSIGFMQRLLEKSGTGDATAWPPGICRSLEPGKPLMDRSVEAARAESERIVCDVTQQVLSKNNISAKDIDVLIVNCSLFSPTPSLCALVAHKASASERARLLSRRVFALSRARARSASRALVRSSASAPTCARTTSRAWAARRRSSRCSSRATCSRRRPTAPRS